MAFFTGKTTAPGASSHVALATEVEQPVLVIAGSKLQPHRVGQVAFFPLGETLYVGRGDAPIEEFAHFVEQVPGEVPAVDPHEEILAGDSVSKRQLKIRGKGDCLEMDRVGQCRTFVNGVEVDKATIWPGDTILLRDEVLLLCVLRPRMLPRPAVLQVIHPYGEPDAFGIVGQSAAAWRLRAQLATAARTRHHVLIQGDSGSGKELAARAIHLQSRWKGGPLVSANAKTLPLTLIESEIFGNVAKYPNPEMPAREGLVGQAHGGTLYLDEIGELSDDAQAQLLRVADEGEYRRLGDLQSRRSDFRLIGATNKDDSAMREDFVARFARRIRLVPLAERREDIPLLIRHLVLTYVTKEDPEAGKRLLAKTATGRLEPRMDLRLVNHLVRRPLSANARDLNKLVIAAIDASEGDTLILPPEWGPQRPSLLPRPKDDSSKKKELEAELAAEDWNLAKVARKLGISRQALYRQMKSLGIEREK